MNILFIAANNIGMGYSGGDTIWINLAKWWSKEHKVTVCACWEAYMTAVFKLSNVDFHICSPSYILKNMYSKWSICKNAFYKLNKALKTVNKHMILYKEYDMVISVSDFLPDLIPALWIKLANPRVRWVAAYYLFAPYPLRGEKVYSTDRIRGICYWLLQRITYPLVKKYADCVLVTGDGDKDKFPKTVVVRGGVDKTGTANRNPKYDVLFIGRFHRQKGIFELLDAWNYIKESVPQAKMCMVGSGELYEEAYKRKTESVDMPGFLYGESLEEVIKNSKVIVHPAFYDSGGMAMAQGMAYGLPGVMLDLPQLKSYYSKGVLKSESYAMFAYNVISLLVDQKLYDTLSRQAKKDIEERWLWEKQQKRILEEICA